MKKIQELNIKYSLGRAYKQVSYFVIFIRSSKLSVE
jgi:hypothetical protein